jgi:hypothetical protein
MNFDTLLQSLEDDGAEKTAAAQEPQGPDMALQAALKNTLEKSASASGPAPSASNPVDDLEKLAEEIANTEKEAEVIHAANMGRAFADAALDEFSAAEAKVAHIQPPAPALAPAAPAVSSGEVDQAVKLAAEIGYADAQNAVAEATVLDKMASGTPEEKDHMIKAASVSGREDLLVKAAADAGYRDTQVKIAEEQYSQGENDALEQVHTVATNEFLKGAQETSMLIAKARQQQAG